MKIISISCRKELGGKSIRCFFSLLVSRVINGGKSEKNGLMFVANRCCSSNDPSDSLNFRHATLSPPALPRGINKEVNGCTLIKIYKRDKHVFSRKSVINLH